MTAGVHLKGSQRNLWVPLAPAIIALTAYWFTLLPEIGFHDDAEFGIQAKFLGLTHPPGYPLHSILAGLFSLVSSEPWFATNLLSAMAGAMTVGLLSLLLMELTGRKLVSFIVPLIFAFSSEFWPVSVKTEVYTLHCATFAFSILMLIRWRDLPSPVRALGAGVSYGLTMAAYLANLLFLPVYLWFMWQFRRPRDVIIFLSGFAVIGIAILAWTLFRLKSADPPIGTQYLPDSVAGIWKYFSGAQYNTTQLNGLDHFWRQMYTNYNSLTNNYSYPGIAVIALGIGWLFRRDRFTGTALFFILCISTIYFTNYRAAEYKHMMLPAFFLCALYFGLCMGWILQLNSHWLLKTICLAFAGFLLYSTFATQFSEHRARSTQRISMEYVNRALSLFDENAMVVATWYHFTPLLYHQRVQGERPDIMIVELTDRPRHYPHGTYANDLEAIERNTERSVYLDKRAARHYRQLGFELHRLTEEWYTLELPISK